MSDCEFTIDDNGLQEDLMAFYAGYPTEAVNCLRAVARQFGKDVSAKWPDGGTTGGKRSVKKQWKYENERNVAGMTYAIDARNASPLFHLVENGHELYLNPEMYKAYKAGELHTTGSKKGTSKSSTETVHAGFVAGKHYCADTRDEYQRGKFAETAEVKISAALKKHDL